MCSQADIIKSVIDYLNTEYPKSIPKISFDELSTSKDSICITTSEDSKPIEKVADVTGKWLSGVVNISIVYRAMLVTNGLNDLSYIKVIDDIYNFVKSNYKSIKNNDFYIDSVSQVSGGLLDVIYQGGVKDFKGIVKLSYERRL